MSIDGLGSGKGRALVPYAPPLPPERVSEQPAQTFETVLRPAAHGFDPRNTTPRAIQRESETLYLEGILSWDEHAQLSVQADMHPDYQQTIGALTGETSDPERPRDYIQIWQRRLSFERRHSGLNSEPAQQATHILSLLRRLEHPTDIIA